MAKSTLKPGDVVRIELDWTLYKLVKSAGPRRGWYVKIHGCDHCGVYRFMSKTMHLATVVTDKALIES